MAIRQFQPQAPEGTEQAALERLWFVQSARRASSLRQDRIASVSEVLDEGGSSFAVMEYIPNKTLKEALDHEPFQVKQSTRLVRRMALAVHYANQNGVVHGDLKPSNIFMLPADEIKVSDFAVSPRGWPDPQIMPAAWGHGYLAPEYYSDRKRIGPWSDQYALAAIAYHLYTRHVPFSGWTAEAGDRTMLRPASSVRPELTDATDAVLAKALSSDSAARFGSCLEFSEALGQSFAPVKPVITGVENKRVQLPLVAALGTLPVN